MATSDQNNYLIGVDIGGTKVAAGFVDHTGEITHVTRVPMVCDSDAAAGLNSVIQAIDSLLSKAQQNHWTIRAIFLVGEIFLSPRKFQSAITSP
jgi:glucokinase